MVELTVYEKVDDSIDDVVLLTSKASEKARTTGPRAMLGWDAVSDNRKEGVMAEGLAKVQGSDDATDPLKIMSKVLLMGREKGLRWDGGMDAAMDAC